MGWLLFWGLVVGGFFLLKKFWQEPEKEQTKLPKDKHFGSAEFADNEEVEKGGCFAAGGVPVGYWCKEAGAIPVPLRYTGAAHLITVAPSRSGKFRDVLAAALMEFQGSILAIDPKGQLAAVTARRRREMGQQVFILNPFNILPDCLGMSAQFNPLAALDPQSEAFGADCDNIADALIWSTGGDSHWTDSAKLLASGLVMYLRAHCPPDLQNLATLRAVISSPREVFEATIKDALATGDALICEKLGRFADAGNNKEIASIISTAQTQTGFIGNAAISDNLKASDFRFADLKEKGVTVYLVLPTRYLGACSKWFRLIVAAALDELLREEKGAFPVLMMLDEFAQLGRLKTIENAMALAAGYGVQLWPVVQDLTQLKELYGETWETFLANAGLRQFFAPRDVTTSEYVSKMLGVQTIVADSASYSQNQTGSSSSTSYGKAQRPLLYPDEVRRLVGWEQLLFFDTVRNPVSAGRWPYWTDARFQGLYDPDPYHAPPAAPPFAPDLDADILRGNLAAA